jgi:hypothetical protein
LVRNPPLEIFRGTDRNKFAPLEIAALYRIDQLEETPEHDAAVLWWKRVAQGLRPRPASRTMLRPFCHV